MTYTKQTWTDLPSETTPLSAARLGHMEDGIEAADTEKAALAGATFSGNISAPNMSGIITLLTTASVPANTPAGTLIVRY